MTTSQKTNSEDKVLINNKKSYIFTWLQWLFSYDVLRRALLFIIILALLTTVYNQAYGYWHKAELVVNPCEACKKLIPETSSCLSDENLNNIFKQRAKNGITNPYYFQLNLTEPYSNRSGTG